MRELTLDIECYRNYFLVMFVDVISGHKHIYAQFPGQELDTLAILELIWGNTIITFNGLGYDIPMLSLALTGVSNDALKEASDAIIKGLKYWDFYKIYRVDKPRGLDHVDVMEVAPGVRISLKMYGGRQHSRKMQDLPIEPAAMISLADRIALMQYCGNDHTVTQDLLRNVRPRLELREALSKQYDIDLRSKSDAQMAEAVIKSQLSFDPQRRYVAHGYQFRYQAPACIGFQTPALQAAFKTIRNALFIVNDVDQISNPEELYDVDGKKTKTGVRIPAEVKALRITIGKTTYKLGIGGLHSQESATHHYTIPGKHVITDHDVASYYPSLILLLNMFPEQLGEEFLTIYRKIYVNRLSNKHDAALLEAELKKLKGHGGYAEVEKRFNEFKVAADGLKIVLNGTFGKLFNKYSIMFAPELGIQVTITGQLFLLMLIEYLELNGITVVSANTDGIVLCTPVGMETLRDEIIRAWEKLTGLETEVTHYSAIFSRDVNNYVAFKLDGKHKGKGVFADSGVTQNKHPDADICKDAVIAYLRDGTPLERTIKACQDVRKFIIVRAVKGGGMYVPESATMRYEQEKLVAIDGTQYLGKAVRWYYATSSGWIAGKTSLHKVASSDGAMPLMTLPDTLPDDINYARYCDEAHKMLATLGLRVHYL